MDRVLIQFLISQPSSKKLLFLVDVYKQRQLPKKRIRDMHLTQPYTECVYHTSLLRAQGSLQNRRQKGCKSNRWLQGKSVLRDTVRQLDLWTQSGCDSMYEICPYPSLTPASPSMKGDRHRTPSLARKLMANFSWWERKNHFSPIRVDLLASGLCSSGRSHIQEYLGGTNWFGTVFCLFVLIGQKVG